MDINTLERMVEDVERLLAEMDEWSDDRFSIAADIAGQLLDELNDIDTE